jgi:hypothetical protein
VCVCVCVCVIYTAYNETVAQLKTTNHLSLTRCILQGTFQTVTSNAVAHNLFFNRWNRSNSSEQNLFTVIVTEDSTSNCALLLHGHNMVPRQLCPCIVVIYRLLCNLAQDWDTWRAVFNLLMSLRFPSRAREFVH